MTGRFVPPCPPRGTGPVPVWRGFVGERARTAVYGWSQAAFGQDYMRRKVLGFTVHVPTNPELVQHVLLDNAANYAKPSIVKGLLRPVIGQGLLTSDGALWRDQRKIVAASFTPPAVDALIPKFARAAQATEWQSNAPTDMLNTAATTTMRIIADSLFGGDPRLTSPLATAHISAALEAFAGVRALALLGLPQVALTARARAGRRGQNYLRQTLTDVVRDRIAEPSGDFLSALIADLGERFEPAEAESLAVDNAATFYLAGHETTANAVAWTLFVLSEQPELQDRVAEEAKSALRVGECDEGLPDRLPRLRQVLEETLRLYPPAPRMDRQAAGEDRLGEEPVKPGDIVSIWPWLIHRNRKGWEDPDRFDPDRFLPERKAGRHRFQYLPFGAGPRVCIGMRFATIEALVILATWLAARRFGPVPGRAVECSGMVTLRPKGGLPLIVNER